MFTVYAIGAIANLIAAIVFLVAWMVTKEKDDGVHFYIITTLLFLILAYMVEA